MHASSEKQAKADPPTRVGVVVIGRNEGERLVRCLHSVLGTERPGESQKALVYVDSNSTDRSVEHARALAAEVVDLDTTRKFTAARARNAGLARLLELHPDLEFIQFVDGDCEVDAGWLEVAAAFLRQNADYAVVCGRRRERFPGQSVYNHLCDLEWDTPVGPRASCGGDAMMRVSALRAVSGYRESLIAGEEPEMCFRMRQLGFRVMRLPAEMTLHDAAMFRFGQWFQRCRRAGHASAEMASLHGKHAERPGVRQVLRALFWGIGVPLSALAIGVWLHPTGGLALAILAPAYLFWRSYRSERRVGALARRRPALRGGVRPRQGARGGRRHHLPFEPPPQSPVHLARVQIESDWNMMVLSPYRSLLGLTLALSLLLVEAGCGGPSFIWAKDVPPDRALPHVEDERIRVGDALSITVSGQQQLSGAFLVGVDGAVTMPEVGAIKVAGHPPEEANRLLTDRIATIIQSPRVSVVVAQRRVQVAILGEVKNPGKFQLAAGDGIVEAVASAGGLGEFANGNAIYLVREDEPLRVRFRMKDLLRGGPSARSFTLRDGDLIIVE